MTRQVTRPAQSRDSRLAELVCTATALAHGMGAYDHRLTELGAGCRSRAA